MTPNEARRSDRRIKTLTVAAALALLAGGFALNPTGAAATGTADYAIEYVVDHTNGTLTYRVAGAYSSAIDCATDWKWHDATELSLGKPSMPDLTTQYIITDFEMIEMKSVTLQDTVDIHEIRYYAYLDTGELRVVETQDNVTTEDHLYVCPTFTLDTTPGIDPPEGMVGPEFRAPTHLDGCTVDETDGHGLAPVKIKPDDHLEFEVLDTDQGVCLLIQYAGTVPPTGEACPTEPDYACVPFSGKIEAALKDQATSKSTDVYLEGEACDGDQGLFVVGGYCWGGAPDTASEATFTACGCMVTHTAEAKGAHRSVDREISAAGTWFTNASRAP